MNPVVIAGGARSPIGRFNGALSKVDAVDLGAHAVRAALERTGLEPDYVAVGNVLQAANGQNPGRRAALQGGVRADRARDHAQRRLPGQHERGRAGGGADPRWRGEHRARRRLRLDDPRAARAGTRPAPRMGDKPMIDVMVHDGLYCSIADAGMGAMSDAENARLGITREAQDELAARSHANAAAGADRLAEEIVALPQSQQDEGVRATSLEALAQAAARLHAGRHDHGRQRLAGVRRRRGRGRHHQGARARPARDRARPRGRRRTGLDAAPAPRRGVAQLLDQHGLKAADIALWEINEAFAGVVLASAPDLGIDLERINVNGGAVALGHPLAGSGLRLVLTLAYELRRRGGGCGIATLCGGGGQGEAILLEVD